MSALIMQQQQGRTKKQPNGVSPAAARVRDTNVFGGPSPGPVVRPVQSPPAVSSALANANARAPGGGNASPLRRSDRSSGVATKTLGPKGQDNPDLPDYPRAWVYPLRPWGAPVSAFPSERLRGHWKMIAWEVFTCAFVLYVLVEVPYRIAFSVNLSDQNYIPVCQDDWKIGFDIFSCIVFLADIVVQMHAAFFEDRDGAWELVDRVSDTRAAYFRCLSPFRRSFIWDLGCCFPFLQISCALYFRQKAQVDGSQAYWDCRSAWQVLHFLAWIFRALKFQRLWKLAEASEQAARQSPSVANIITLMNIVLLLFFVAHLFGCIWFVVGSPAPTLADGTPHPDFDSSWTVLTGGIWIEMEDGTYSRRIQACAGCYLNSDPELGCPSACTDDPKMGGGWLYEWLASIYWAVTTMTTIGYGDISAHNNRERIFCMFAMALGSAYFAYLAGTITGILAKGSAGTERFLAFLDEVRQFMDIKRFSDEVKNMVFVFYGLKYPTQLIFNDQEILDSLPKGLRKRMQAETYMRTIENLPLFDSLSESIKMEVCNGFETYYCSKQEELCKEDEEPDCFFVVSNGDVLLTHKGDRIALAQRGQMFGELGLLGLTETGRRMRTATSITECELLRMSKDNFKYLMVTHVPLRVVYRRLAQKFVAMLYREAAEPKSPLHDAEKHVHIFSAWQKGKIPEECRVVGKVPPPVIDVEEEEKLVTTTVHLQLVGLKGFPIIHMAQGAVSVRFVIEYDLGLDKKKNVQIVKHDTMLTQGLPLALDFSTLINYRHGLDPKEAIVNREDIQIRIIYLRWHDEAPGGQAAAVSAQLGFEQPAFATPDDMAKTTPNVGSALPAPHMQTVIGTFVLKLKDLVSAGDATTACRGGTVKTRFAANWELKGHQGPMELTIATKIARELPPNSMIRSVFRSFLQRVHSKSHHEDGSGPDIPQPSRGGAFMNEDRLKKTIKEIKQGIVNMLVKGDAGKSAASAASFEHQQEKAIAAIEKRLRELKDQINNVMTYNKNFELHMSAEMRKTLETLDNRIAESHKQTGNHFEDIKETKFQEINQRILEQQDLILKTEDKISATLSGLESRISEVNAASLRREEHIISLLEQLLKRPSPAPPPLPAPPPPPAPAPPPPPAEPPKAIGSVGLMLGQLMEVSTRDGNSKLHLQVQGVLPGGSAEMSGMFRAGDEIMTVDGVELNGKTLLESKRLFLGLEGTMVQLSVLRPSTGKEFSLSLRRHVFTSDAGAEI